MCASNQTRLLKYRKSRLCLVRPRYESCEVLPREDGPIGYVIGYIISSIPFSKSVLYTQIYPMNRIFIYNNVHNQQSQAFTRRFTGLSSGLNGFSPRFTVLLTIDYRYEHPHTTRCYRLMKSRGFSILVSFCFKNGRTLITRYETVMQPT